MEGIARHNTGMTRSVIEERHAFARNRRIFPVIMDRIVFLGTAVDYIVANILTAQMLFLSRPMPGHLALHQLTGGSVYAGPASTCST
jgi:ATP-dependent Clp protease protease subunit